MADWITETLERVAPELDSNHPPLTGFERLQLELLRDGVELLALIADGSAARGGNQARIDALRAKLGLAVPATSTRMQNQ